MASTGNEFVVYQRGEDNESDVWDDSVLIKAYDDAVSAMKTKIAEEHPEFSAPQPSSKAKKKRNRVKQKKKTTSSPVWKSGDRCQATYTLDGELYEARILTVDQSKGSCMVQYLGYGNEEEQKLSDLLPPGTVTPSHKTDTASETESVNQVPDAQEKRTRSSKRSAQTRSTQHNKHTVPPWPRTGFPPQHFPRMPPPPAFPGFPPHPFPGFPAAPPMFPCMPPPPPLFDHQGPGDENEALYSMLISWYMSGYHTGYYQGLKQASANVGTAQEAPR